MPQDARRDPRRPTAWPLQWALLHDQQKIYQGKTKDLSIRGTLAILDHNLPPNTRVLLNLQPPASRGQRDSLCCQARVAHCAFSASVQAFLVGLEFRDVPATVQAKLTRHLSGLAMGDVTAPAPAPDEDASYLEGLKF